MPPAAKPLAAMSARPLDPARLAAANINPATLLATDYLNRFNEPVMLLDLLATSPECLDDLLAWRPASYREHFAASRQAHRDVVISAYEAADLSARRRLDELADAMNAILLAAREALRREPQGAGAAATARRAAARLKPLMARAAALIAGREMGGKRVRSGAVQAAVDALMER
jgi:hypothetical protein